MKNLTKTFYIKLGMYYGRDENENNEFAFFSFFTDIYIEVFSKMERKYKDMYEENFKKIECFLDKDGEVKDWEIKEEIKEEFIRKCKKIIEEYENGDDSMKIEFEDFGGNTIGEINVERGNVEIKGNIITNENMIEVADWETEDHVRLQLKEKGDDVMNENMTLREAKEKDIEEIKLWFNPDNFTYDGRWMTKDCDLAIFEALNWDVVLILSPDTYEPIVSKWLNEKCVNEIRDEYEDMCKKIEGGYNFKARDINKIKTVFKNHNFDVNHCKTIQEIYDYTIETFKELEEIKMKNAEILIHGSLWVNNAKYEYVDKIIVDEEEVEIYYQGKIIGNILRSNIETFVEENHENNITTDLIDNLSYLFDLTKEGDL